MFVSRWMRGGEMRVEDGCVRILWRGRRNFVPRVAERCFDAARALRAAKRVLYVTPVGVFRATPSGLELVSVIPGVDVRRDVLAMAPFPIAVPAAGEVSVVDLRALEADARLGS